MGAASQPLAAWNLSHAGQSLKGRWTRRGFGPNSPPDSQLATLSPPLHLISLPPTCGPHGRQPEAPVGANAPACLESLVQSVQTADWEMGAERRCHFFKNLQGVQTETCSENKMSDASSRAVIYRCLCPEGLSPPLPGDALFNSGLQLELPSLHNSQASVIGQAWVT